MTDTTRTSSCVVCYRTKGPGELTFYPVYGHPDIGLGIHERHRISTICAAGIYLKLVKARRKKKAT